MALPMPHDRFTVAEYERMIAGGILTEDDRVELIEGEIIAMSPVGSRHFECVTNLLELIIGRKPDTVRVTMQNPIRLLDESEPEPDLTIMRAKRYWRRIPTVADVLIVIEVSDSTRNYDYGTKMPLYARAGVPELWIVDLMTDRVERYTEPDMSTYQQIHHFERGSIIESAAVPELAIPVDSILEPPDDDDPS
ncbi:MAG: Uma2 family endonuclease [Chloroflexota bacterium]|nr:Uma2 family endonuclease [Chloroflexota bacterium]